MNVIKCGICSATFPDTEDGEAEARAHIREPHEAGEPGLVVIDAALVRDIIA